MNRFNITGFLVIGLVSITLLTVMGMMENVKAQLTDFDTLFDKPEYQLCRQSFNDTTSSDPAEWTSEEICDVPIAIVNHQTNTSMLLRIDHLGYSGTILDAVTKEGYKPTITVPDYDPSTTTSVWIYFGR